MTLNRDDFPEMTDEQWSAIKAEGDRRATQASATAKAGLLKPEEVQAQIDDALDKAKAKLEADEQGKLEIERKELAEAQTKLAAERKTLVATKKLAAAGLPEDKVESLLSLFVNIPDADLDASLDTFVKLHQETVKGEVDAEKQKLLGNATPPAGNPNTPVDNNTAAMELIGKGDEVGAIDLMLKDAGLTE
jgi:uncharacterized protein YbcC (UPF0753/DUF2309 family)